MEKILVVLSNSNDGCSWYRGIGPWSEIHRQGLLDVYYSPKPTWKDVRAVDAVFMLRPCTKDLKEGAQAAKDFGRPLIVDYDDDLLDIPRDNPAFAFFNLQDIKQNVKEFLTAADGVVASTEFLGKKLAAINPNVKVIRNAYDPCLNKFRSLRECNKSVIWRGTETHHRDVASVADQIVEVAAMHPNYLFIFMGNDPAPWACSERIKKSMRVEKLDLMNYFKAISALKPRVVITPLAETDFNKGKSNIAAIEAAYAGAPTIAPNWQEWQFPGVINYTDANPFGACLDRVLRDDEFRASHAAAAWDSVQSKYSLNAANAQRVKLVQSLVRAA